MASSSSSDYTDEFLQLVLSGNLDSIKKTVKQLSLGDRSAATIRDANMNCPLHVAAKGGHVVVCKYLVEKLKIDVDVTNLYGETPLIVAAKGAHYPVARYLLKKGANPNSLTFRKVTALHFAAEKGSKELLELLISEGAVVDAISSSYGTPLHSAARGNEEAVRILLDNHAKPNINIQSVHTPLGISVAHRSFQCVKLLVEKGADVNTRSLGFPPLQLAAITGKNEIIIKYLLDSGVEPNVNYNVRTPLEHATLRHNYKAVEILFPVTDPLPDISDWSIEGVIKHFNDCADEHEMVVMADKISAFKSKAHYALMRNEHDVAIQMHSEVLKLDPLDLDSMVTRCCCRFFVKDGKSALDDSEACIAKWPNRDKGYLMKAKSLRTFYNDPVGVADSYSQAMLISPENLKTQGAYWEAIDSEFYWMRSLCDIESLGFKNSAKSRTIR